MASRPLQNSPTLRLSVEVVLKEQTAVSRGNTKAFDITHEGGFGALPEASPASNVEMDREGGVYKGGLGCSPFISLLFVDRYDRHVGRFCFRFFVLPSPGIRMGLIGILL
ncbi:unnamed protein product [Bursaphelenchus okinawaensis]|uniref:Uncharacterized protein n=1 Tax=Bursaphelenchus okinawaensis TaxID=465554 RepID=A0A811LHK3_9BILA|nr:unnamed protein product [Bursaphelenchus okinawaensis]CAG9125603.1 unnamed protein product [Bursaphelenchus okinawaensis]